MKKKIVRITLLLGLMLSQKAICYNGEVDDEQEVALVGREYYDSLLEDAAYKHWVVKGALYHSLAFKGFGCNKQCTSLAGEQFGQNPIRVQDIFLMSRLAAKNLIRANDDNALSIVRPTANPAVPFGGDRFGSFVDDLPIFHLANMEANFTIEERELGADLTAAYRLSFGCNNELDWVFGVNLPVKSHTCIIDLQLLKGNLYQQGALPPTQTGAESSVINFFRDYEDVFDFFVRAVLEPKGITLLPRQSKVGIGDLALFTYLDFAGYFDCMDALQVGMHINVPTGGKMDCNCDSLCPMELGNGGASQFDGFFNAIFSTRSDAFNPTVYFAAQGSATFTGARRVPKLVVNVNPAPDPRIIPGTGGQGKHTVKQVPDLINPIDRLNGFYVDNFSELDSLVPAFADHLVRSRIKYGSQIKVGFGNYFYNIVYPGIKLGVMYDYTRKGEDKIEVLCDSENFDVCAATACTKTQAHRIGWSLAYQFKNQCELNIGSQHIVAGRNVPQLHECFASLVLVF
ncbi:MAG TPA: hypothetical protein VGT41_05625 [Candidatus Babeliales bacterium]|nr:hypothetical protein [Candidatus Babeliales bacterium]